MKGATYKINKINYLNLLNRLNQLDQKGGNLQCRTQDGQIFCKYGEKNLFCGESKNVSNIKILSNEMPTQYNSYHLHEPLTNDYVQIQTQEETKDTNTNVCGNIYRILIIGGGIQSQTTYQNIAKLLKQTIPEFKQNDLYQCDILDNDGKEINPSYYIYIEPTKENDNAKCVLNYVKQYHTLIEGDTFSNSDIKIPDITYDYIMFDYSVIKFIKQLSIKIIEQFIKKLAPGGKFMINSNQMKADTKTNYDLDVRLFEHIIDVYNKMETYIYDLNNNPNIIVIVEPDINLVSDMAECFKKYQEILRQILIHDSNVEKTNETNKTDCKMLYNMYEQYKQYTVDNIITEAIYKLKNNTDCKVYETHIQNNKILVVEKLKI